MKFRVFWDVAPCSQIRLLVGCDERLANVLSTATKFKGTSNRIQNNLINSVADVMFEEIKVKLPVLSLL
jgi:hypothetical protein